MKVDNFNGKLPPDVAAQVGNTQVSYPEGFDTVVSGYDFAACDGKVNFDKMLSEDSLSTGLQATMFGRAIAELKRMIEAKLNGSLTEEEIKKQREIPTDNWQPTPCTIFLSYTSNLISGGTRESLRYLVQHKMVDCISSTAGGIEEDFIKCLIPSTVGTFELAGKDMFEKKLNRNGNIVLSLKHYALFEDWVIPIYDQMLKEQDEGTKWTPSTFIHRLGKEINNPESVYYWAWKNNIPVFCPPLTDGGIGDLLFFHSFKHDGRNDPFCCFFSTVT